MYFTNNLYSQLNQFFEKNFIQIEFAPENKNSEKLAFVPKEGAYNFTILQFYNFTILQFYNFTILQFGFIELAASDSLTAVDPSYLKKKKRMSRLPE